MYKNATEIDKSIRKDKYTDVTFTTADTEQAVKHYLNRIPIGYVVVSTDKAAIVYKGTTADTNELIYLRSNVDDTDARLIII